MDCEGARGKHRDCVRAGRAHDRDRAIAAQVGQAACPFALNHPFRPFACGAAWGRANRCWGFRTNEAGGTPAYFGLEAVRVCTDGLRISWTTRRTAPLPFPPRPPRPAQER